MELGLDHGRLGVSQTLSFGARRSKSASRAYSTMVMTPHACSTILRTPPRARTPQPVRRQRTQRAHARPPRCPTRCACASRVREHVPARTAEQSRTHVADTHRNSALSSGPRFLAGSLTLGSRSAPIQARLSLLFCSSASGGGSYVCLPSCGGISTSRPRTTLFCAADISASDLAAAAFSASPASSTPAVSSARAGAVPTAGSALPRSCALTLKGLTSLAPTFGDVRCVGSPSQNFGRRWHGGESAPTRGRRSSGP